MKIILISGASGSGKTTLANLLVKLDNNIKLISIDNYYLNKEEQIKKNGFCNFDYPDSFDCELLIKNINELTSIGTTQIPQYCFDNHDRIGYKKFNSGKILIIEGIYAGKLLANKNYMNIYVDIDLDLALIRRIKRDMNSRNRTLDSILDQYLEFVRPAYIKYVKDMKLSATTIIQNNGLKYELNDIAIELYDKIRKEND
ncbi:MAG: uridine kinase [Epsilonproteobacteria bacterium]|nr:MAG: uridine kinase [Campylobacterota bacterium]